MAGPESTRTLGFGKTIAAEWQARGIDPDTIALHHGTAIASSRMRPALLRQTLGALPPLLSQGEGAAQFTVAGVLGEGGMGVVRLGVQTALGREVALKSLRDDVATEQAAASLLQEARVTGALEHPHVVPVHALGRDEQDRPLLVMKRIEGRSWAEHIAEEQDRAGDGYLARQLGILRQVAMAVGFAHSKGVLHRDIKPDNVMIGSFGEVYLVDWGIACNLKPDGVRGLPLAREINAVEGTPAYLAPEMAIGSGADIDERSDVYLLGATLHEILTGQPPHFAATLHDMLAKAFTSEPYDYGPKVPRALGAICHKAMARFGADRHPNAAAFAAALDEYLTHRASTLLSDEAAARLTELDAACRCDHCEEDKVAAAQSLFAELRLSFQLALRSWAGNEAAEAGLRRALESMIDFELRRGAPDAAAGYLRDLRDPPAELAARVERAQADRAAARDRLSKLERDRDLSIGERERRRLTRGLGAAWGTGYLGASVAALVGLLTVDLRVAAIALDLLFAAAVILGRVVLPSLGVTEANRNLMLLSAVNFLGMAGVFALGLAFGVALAPCCAAATVAAAMLWLAIAVSVDRNWHVLAVANVLEAVGCWAAPLYAFEIVGVFGFVGAMLASGRWIKDARSQ